MENEDPNIVRLKIKELKLKNALLLQELNDKKKPSRTFKLDAVTATIAAALIGFLGTTLANYRTTLNANELETRKFEYDLIRKGLEQPQQAERIKFLNFLIKLHLIENPKMSNALDSIIKHPENIPHIESETVQGSTKIGGTKINFTKDLVFFTSECSISADGAPTAYHPDGKSGLDYLANAGKTGHWFAIETDDGKPTGNPIIQGKTDPAPGFYVSTTALANRALPRQDPNRYVNASTIPYIVIPRKASFDGINLGSIALVYNNNNGKYSYAIVADFGPAGSIGIGSIALAKKLSINPDVKKGGKSGGISYFIFKGKKIASEKINDLDEIEKLGNEAMAGRKVADLVSTR